MRKLSQHSLVSVYSGGFKRAVLRMARPCIQGRILLGLEHSKHHGQPDCMTTSTDHRVQVKIATKSAPHIVAFIFSSDVHNLYPLAYVVCMANNSADSNK